MSTVYIFLMAVITFSCRFLFLQELINFKLHPELEKLLRFTAPSVLTAMWAPIVFVSDNQLNEISSPQVLAGVITIAASLTMPKKTFLIVLIGMLSFILLSFDF